MGILSCRGRTLYSTLVDYTPVYKCNSLDHVGTKMVGENRGAQHISIRAVVNTWAWQTSLEGGHGTYTKHDEQGNKMLHIDGFRRMNDAAHLIANAFAIGGMRNRDPKALGTAVYCDCGRCQEGGSRC